MIRKIKAYIAQRKQETLEAQQFEQYLEDNMTNHDLLR